MLNKHPCAVTNASPKPLSRSRIATCTIIKLMTPSRQLKLCYGQMVKTYSANAPNRKLRLCSCALLVAWPHQGNWSCAMVKWSKHTQQRKFSYTGESSTSTPSETLTGCGVSGTLSVESSASCFLGLGTQTRQLQESSLYISMLCASSARLAWSKDLSSGISFRTSAFFVHLSLMAALLQW